MMFVKYFPFHIEVYHINVSHLLNPLFIFFFHYRLFLVVSAHMHFMHNWIDFILWNHRVLQDFWRKGIFLSKFFLFTSRSHKLFLPSPCHSQTPCRWGQLTFVFVLRVCMGSGIPWWIWYKCTYFCGMYIW